MLLVYPSPADGFQKSLAVRSGTTAATSFNFETCSFNVEEKNGADLLSRSSNTVSSEVTFHNEPEISPRATPSCRAFL